MSENDRGNHGAMKEISPFTKLQPKQRAEKNQEFINYYNKDPNNEIIKINGQRKVNGFRLNELDIELGDGRVKTMDGAFNFKNKIKTPAVFNNWVFVYSRSNKSNYDDKDADDAYSLFKSCSSTFGIKFEEPGFITVQGNHVEDWKKEITKDIETNGAPQIVVLFFQKH